MDLSENRMRAKIRFVVALFFESGDETIPYYSGGTCIVVRYEDQFYIFTARHSANRAPGKAIIMYPHLREPIPIKKEFDVDRSNADSGDELWTDVLCYTTYKTNFWDDIEENDYIDLTNFDPSLEPNSILRCAGYPHKSAFFEEPNRITRIPEFTMGSYAGHSESRNCHLFRRINNSKNKPAGMSGGPIFSIHLNDQNDYSFRLEGMVLQGTDKNPDLRYVHAEVLWRVAKQLTKTAEKSQ